MTEEIKTCDFYNEKICTLFSKYFGFNVECEKLSLSTIDSDIEQECPIKRLEQENKDLRKANEISIEKITVTAEAKRLQELEQENKELKEKKDKYYQQTLDDEILMNELSLEVDLRKKESDFYLEKLSKYRSALEEISGLASPHCTQCSQIINIINEVLQ